jgi:biotin operon repressor
VQKSKISPTSDEFVLDQLSISEEKLLKLLEELEQSGKDVDELSRLIEEEDVRSLVLH